MLLINACKNTTEKIVIEKDFAVIKSEKNLKILAPSNNKKYFPNKIVRKIINFSEEKTLKKSDYNEVIFEFKNERLLQGRNNENLGDKQKTNKALTAVYNMFKQGLTLDSNNLNLKNNDNVSMEIDYSLNLPGSIVSFNKNILVFLPLTGSYSHFGTKIRKSIDVSILKFGTKNIDIIYYDTGKKIDVKELQKMLDIIDPYIVIGPFTRSSLLKIKPFIKKKSIPMFTFTNDIALIEKNIWSLGFSPEEQVDSVISCALINGYKRFGLIAPNNLYGNIILNRSIDLMSNQNNISFQKLSLSNKQLNNKNQLLTILKQFLNYKKNQNETHSKFDSIFIGGSKEFILEISPLLAFYDVDARYVQILGTEKFNTKEIKNEPSLEGSWFPMIFNKNLRKFKSIKNEKWIDEEDYFSSVGFDTSMLAINFLNQEKNLQSYLNNAQGFVSGFSFNINGYIKKPISVMAIQKLGSTKKVIGCDNFN